MATIERIDKTKGSSKWEIEVIMCGDDTVSGNFVYGKGLFFASNCVKGSIQTFHVIDPQTCRVYNQSGSKSVINWSTYAVTDKAKQVPASGIRGIRIQKKFRSNANYISKRSRDRIIEWCLQNPGHGVSISVPGSRNVGNTNQSLQCMELGRIVFTQAHGSCLVISIANALSDVGRNNIAAKFVTYMSFKFFRPPLQTIKSAIHHLEKLNYKCELRKLRRKDQEEFSKDPLKYISNAVEGKFIVSIRQVGIVNHVIYVNADKGIIVDGFEEYPLKLSVESIKACAGCQANKFIVGEIRRLVPQ